MSEPSKTDSPTVASDAPAKPAKPAPASHANIVTCSPLMDMRCATPVWR